jgi:hypothetical protein
MLLSAVYATTAMEARMGKLYDRRDMEFELREIDKLEVRAGQTLAPIDFAKLDGTMKRHEDRSGKRTFRYSGSIFEKARRSARMQLLRSGSLMRDLRYAMGLFKSCAHCFTDAQQRRRPCDKHRAIVQKASSAVYWAGQDNLELRAAQGRTDEAEEVHDGGCNELEQWYYQDKRDKVWPGVTPEALAYNKERYDSLGYVGWLNMLLDEEEISLSQHQAELVRLREGANGT